MSDNKNTDRLNQTLSDLLIMDVFGKHGVTVQKRRNISPEQKQQIKELVRDLQQQVDSFVKGNNPDPSKAAETAAKAEKLEEQVQPEAPKRRRRFTIRRD